MSMIRIATFAAAFVLVVHGLIHLMGTAVYARHAEIKGLSYKTTLLSGHWELGEGGIRVFGWLWVLPAIGFAAAALALPGGWGWWKPVLIGATLLSLAITALDWSNAFMGAIVDIVILALVLLSPRFTAWTS
jgi:hypothetical protein